MQLTTKKFILTILIFTLAITGVSSQGKKDALKLYRNGDYAEAIKVKQSK